MAITEPKTQSAGEDQAAIEELHEVFAAQKAAFLKDTYPSLGRAPEPPRGADRDGRYPSRPDPRGARRRTSQSIPMPYRTWSRC